MKSKVLLISLVFVALALSISGVSASFSDFVLEKGSFYAQSGASPPPGSGKGGPGNGGTGSGIHDCKLDSDHDNYKPGTNCLTGKPGDCQDRPPSQVDSNFPSQCVFDPKTVNATETYHTGSYPGDNSNYGMSCFISDYINPGASEACNGVDDDCDGKTDEDYDRDGDGITSCGSNVSSTKREDPYFLNDKPVDCDDDPSNDGHKYPNQQYVYLSNSQYKSADSDNDGNLSDERTPTANEVCDGIDNDCDGKIDEGFDKDGDGYTTCGTWTNGSSYGSKTAYTGPPDCNDNNASIHPGATEKCDSVNWDCSGGPRNGLSCGTNSGSTPSSFYWKNSSGRIISSIGIRDSGKTVEMFANYGRKISNSEGDFRVYDNSSGKLVYEENDVSVTRHKLSSTNPNMSHKFEINQSWMSKLSGSSPFKIYYNYTTIDSWLSPANFKKGPTLKVKNLSENKGSGKKCDIYNGFSCVKNSKACKQGNIVTKGKYGCSGTDVCCNESASSGSSKDFCEKNSNRLNFCNDYENESRCESNTCELPPVNGSGCDGNCGCRWNSTGSGPSQGSCLGFVNGSETKGMPDDGLCLQVSNSSDTCGDDGVLETSWDVKWRNTSSGETYTKQSKIPASCQPGSKRTTCPSIAKLPAENNWTIPLTVFVLVGVYAFFYARRN